MGQPHPGFLLSFTHVPPEEIPGHQGPGRPTSRLGQLLHDHLLIGRREVASLREDLQDTRAEVAAVRAAFSRLRALEEIFVGLEERIRRLEHLEAFRSRFEI